MEKKWKKLLLLTLCKLPLQERQEALKEAGFTLPEILGEICSSFAILWREKEEVNGHNLRELLLPVEKWLMQGESPVKEQILEAFRVMKISYVFQIYGYPAIHKDSFSVAFRRNFTKEDADAAETFLEINRKKTKVPPFENVILFEKNEQFWLRKTWGM